MAEFKDRLREALEKRGMSNAELARRAEMDKGAITRYLKGENQPGSNAIAKMAEALNVRPGWLIGGEGDIDELLIVEIFTNMNTEERAKLMSMAKAIKEGLI